MTIDINLFIWSITLLPILVLLLLMVKFKIPAAKAAPIGLVTALIIALLVYRANWSLIAIESAKGLWNAFTILIVVWPAILIYEVTNEANAFDAFRIGMQKLSPNKLLQILAIGWVFVSFLQGITGFGVPIAVGAPLLIGIGVQPIWAVVIPLLAHAWAGTFGTLAVAWNSLLFQTGYSGTTMANTIGIWATAFIWITNLIAGLSICYSYGKWKGVKKGFIAVLSISIIHGGGQMILSQINQTLAAFLPTCMALGAVFLLGKSKFYKEKWDINNSEIMDRKNTKLLAVDSNITISEAFLPYYVLTFITLFILLIPPVNKFLSNWKVGFSFPETSTGYGIINEAITLYSPISPFTHASTFLLISGLVGYSYLYSKGKIKKGGGKRIFRNIVKKTTPSSIAIVCLIIMSRIMSGTGQTTVLATGTSMVLGKAYVIVAPLIGLLGSFMTSSNMSSNILFGGFQKTTSELLGLNQAAIIGAQTAGGAIGNSMAPGSIILGTTTAKILGSEGEVLKRTLPIAIGTSVLCGIILYIALIII